MATQKEWELETRIKSLEHNDLGSIYYDYCAKIDSIIQNAIGKLEREKPKDWSRNPYSGMSNLELLRKGEFLSGKGLSQAGLQGVGSLAACGRGGHGNAFLGIGAAIGLGGSFF